MRQPLTMSASDWLFLIALSLLWGSSFYFAELAITEVPPLTLTLLRVGIAALIIVPIAILTGKAAAARRIWPAFIVLGLFNNAIPFTLIFWSQTHITSGLASILNATAPMFTLVIAHFATTDERFTPRRAVGVVAGFIGVTIMIGPELLYNLGTHVLAQLGGLLAALSYGIGSVYARRLRSEHPLTVAGGQLTASTVIMIPIASFANAPWTLPTPSTTVIMAVLAIAALSTALGYLLFFRVLARAGANNVMLVTFLIPVSAIFLGTVLLNESLTPNQIAGAAMIAIGLAIVDGRPVRLITGAFGRAI